MVWTPFIKSGLLQIDSSLFKQGYQYYLGLGERPPLSKEELDVRLSKINSIEDYERAIDFLQLDYSNKILERLRSNIYVIEKIRNLFFVIQILLQISNAIIVFRLTQIRLAENLMAEETIRNDDMTDAE